MESRPVDHILGLGFQVLGPGLGLPVLGLGLGLSVLGFGFGLGLVGCSAIVDYSCAHIVPE